MRSMESLVERIKRHEGFTEFPTIDVSPMYVIGYGHDIGGNEISQYKDGISEDDAMDLLMSDLDNIKKQIAEIFPWAVRLDDNRYAVFQEMCYQLGVHRVNGFGRMITALREDDYDRAAHEMMWNDSACTIKTDWHKQTPERCIELAGLMKSGG